MGSGSGPGARIALRFIAQVGMGCNGRLVRWRACVLPTSRKGNEFDLANWPSEAGDCRRGRISWGDTRGQVQLS